MATKKKTKKGKRGGARPGAGRKVTPGREGFVKRMKRAPHDPKRPVRVTLHAIKGAPDLRSERAFGLVRICLDMATARRIRVLAFGVQAARFDLLLEADDDRDLARSVQWLASRVTLAINLTLGRRGSLWRDRHERRDITKPEEWQEAWDTVLAKKKTSGALTEPRTALARRYPPR